MRDKIWRAVRVQLVVHQVTRQCPQNIPKIHRDYLFFHFSDQSAASDTLSQMSIPGKLFRKHAKIFFSFFLDVPSSNGPINLRVMRTVWASQVAQYN